MFKYIPNLKYIILGNNEISDIDPRTFEGLSDVLGLALNDNKIAKINDAKLFSETKNLVMLRLDNNQINEICSDAFRNLSQLAILYLNGNQLTRIRSNWFEKQKNLLELVLCDNLVV